MFRIGNVAQVTLTQRATHHRIQRNFTQLHHRLVSQVASADYSKRKTKQRILNLKSGDGVCAAYCVSTPISLGRLNDYLKSPAFAVKERDPSPPLKINGTQVFSGDVIHAPLYAGEDDLVSGHAFFFTSGAAVFWGLPHAIRKQLIDMLSKFQERSSFPSLPRVTGSAPLGMEEFDHDFTYTIDPSRNQPTFKNDAIWLTNFSDPEQLLALSYGLAQSVKLLLFEEIIDLLVLRTRSLPDELARDGNIKLSQKDLKRLIGELLAARYSVNLVSDILDTPEYFWQHPELESLHLECAREVELRQRARILDTRTQVIKDALDILNNELSSSSSIRVERAILFLIAVEVSMEVARLVSMAGSS